MKATTSLALIVSAVAITSVNGGSLLAAVLRPRAIDEIWGGVNITAAVLEVYNAISQPTCNSTDACEQLSTVVVPKCLELEGTAGCWCTLHDPIHVRFVVLPLIDATKMCRSQPHFTTFTVLRNCMTSPIDDTTSPNQTRAAIEGHANYHSGCSAFQASLNPSDS